MGKPNNSEESLSHFFCLNDWKGFSEVLQVDLIPLFDKPTNLGETGLIKRFGKGWYTFGNGNWLFKHLAGFCILLQVDFEPHGRNFVLLGLRAFVVNLSLRKI